MLHDTSESDFTSIGPSSASPNAYYVQSPSRDSNDETDKCSSSNSRSPLDSPSFPRHSMASSSSTAASRISGNRRRWNKHYCDVVAEEDGALDEDYYGDRGYSRQCKWLMVVLAFGLVFAGICLVVWEPAGLTKLKFVSSILTYNPARFFGIHVSFPTANLIYYQITVATGQRGRLSSDVWARSTWNELETCTKGHLSDLTRREEILPTKKEQKDNAGESGRAGDTTVRVGDGPVGL
ncbi:UNVERIFIED_CONTAM: hypothetical protein Slati_2878100 [Sesamum latifolium]|uniref:Uncharacterized protein n=1 Tax=Sesamum latifolium TaxID=2727402 RepID=A0AAW2VCV6_9LAMI